MIGDACVAVRTNVLSLCAGGGGLDLGVGFAVPDARTVCYVENEVTAASVLVANMEAERLSPAPLWTDLRTFDGRAWRGVVDLVIGGYPCQPFSNAGKRLGADDPRHLWPDVRRIVGEVQPERCFFENVGAHLRLGFHEVARDLQGMGYTVAGVLLTAEEVGAPHGRERLFILAYRNIEHGDRGWNVGPRGGAESTDRGRPVGDSHRGEHHGREQEPWRRSQRRAIAAGTGGTDDVETLADARRLSGPLPSSGESGDARGRTAARTGGECDDTHRAVEYAAGDGRGEGRPEHGVGRGRNTIADSGGAVGDAYFPRLEGRFGTVDGSLYELPAWAPGPSDDEGWAAVVAAGRLDLLPATPQSEVRGVATRVAEWMGRSDQIHILGNGVVPAQAAYAFHLLSEAMETNP